MYPRLIILLLITIACSGPAGAQGRYLDAREGCKVWVSYTLPNCSATWSGACRDGYATGKGTRVVYDHDTIFSTYYGDVVEGKPQGQGKITYASGNVHQGAFARGELNGQATSHFTNGETYTGSFLNGVRSGMGELHFANGNSYKGEFRNDTYYGTGHFRFPSGEQYDGDFVAGVEEGKGRITLPNGDSYEGDFKKNKFDGNGTYRFKSGRVWTGPWVAGEFKGDKNAAAGTATASASSTDVAGIHISSGEETLGALQKIEGVLNRMLDGRANAFAAHRLIEMNHKSGSKTYMVNNVTDYPTLEKNSVIPTISVTDDGSESTYTLVARGLAVSTTAAVAFQNLLTPARKNAGYTMETMEKDAASKQYTLQQGGVPVAICQTDAGKLQAIVVILGK